MSTPKRRVTVAVVTMAAALTACGGSSSSSTSTSSAATPAAYVKSICSAVAPFEKDETRRSQALNLTSISNAADGRKALVTFLNAIAADADQTVAKLRAAGIPNVSNGKAISNGIVSAFAQLKAALATAATQAASLPTNSATAFKNAATGLGKSVQSSMGGISNSLAGLKSQKLEQAAAKDPTCKSLASG